VRSIFAKILLWSLGTFALSLVAFWALARSLEGRPPGPDDLFGRMVAMQEGEACRSFEEGGPERLAAFLGRLDSYFPAEHHLADSRGRDLVSGQDWSTLLWRRHANPGPPRLHGDRMVFVGRPRDDRYRFLAFVRPRFDPRFNPWNILPFYGAVVLVIALMGSVLAAHLAAPLRGLRRVVDRFGQGDLAARVGSTRKDEIGELARAFDQMAGRIETLMTAERRLLQDVSHELRSPLARLVFAVELARTSEDRGASLDRIKKDFGRLSHLVDELLQLTRAEGDPMARELEQVRLDDLIRNVIEDCRLEAEAKACRLVLHTGAAATVQGGRELLRRAVENVLRNAIRYAPQGTDIEVVLRRREDAATIHVRDHGIGVPEESLGAIFEPFFRVEGDRSRSSGGVGLGLAITRRAISLHGGTIVASNAGPGLNITLELPLATRAPGSLA